MDAGKEIEVENSLKIKVCGLLHPGNIEEVCALEPDFAGYIFYPGSRRYVGKKPDPSIFGIPGKSTLKVGVFVNEEIGNLKRIFERFRLDLVQLHGSESPAYCTALKDAGIQVIRSVNPQAAEHDPGSLDHGDEADYLLFDTPGSGFGGTGRKFEWKLLEGLHIPIPFLLGGGIGPGDVEAIRKVRHGKLIGVDVNSRFELSPGLKDTGMLRQFIGEIRRSNKGLIIER